MRDIGVEENIFQTQAEPVEKLLLLTFDNHWITPNTKRVDQCMMRIQFVRKPVRPFRDSWNPVNVRDGSPNKSLVRACQQSPSRAGRHVSRGELFRHADEVTQRLLSSGKLYRAFETLRVSFETHSDGLYARPLHHEPVSQRDCRTNRRDLRISAYHRDQMGSCLSGRIRQDLSDETVETKLDACRCLLRALHIGEPAEPKMSIFHSRSFFSCVRI